MTYTLKGDREIEYAFMRSHPPSGTGRLLDLGPSPGEAATSRFALAQGYQVVAVGLEPIRLTHPGLTFIQGDFLEAEVVGLFDWALCISTIEHFGLAGRYGVTVDDPEADLKGMRKLRNLLRPGARLLLTVPVGVDAVVGSLHRVYGRERLPLLLEGYETKVQKYWAKMGEVDAYRSVSPGQAMNVESIARSSRPLARYHYYALGGFVLERP
jgi:SAM-dependent methyltransferase